MAIFLSKKNTLFLGLMVFSCASLVAQFNSTSSYPKLDPWTINSSGHKASLSAFTLDWNLGDFAHSIHFSNNEISFVTTGYLQSSYPTLLLKEKLDSILLQVKLGPNPFKNTILISCNQDALTIDAILLFDEQGNRLVQVKGPFSGVHFEQRITVSPLKKAYCFIQIQFTLGNEQYLKTYKLIQY